MLKHIFQSGFLSILYSFGSKPLQRWDKEDPTEGLKKLVDPRLGDNCPIDSVMKHLFQPLRTRTLLPSLKIQLFVKAAIDWYKKACSDSSGAGSTSKANAQMRGGEALWELEKKTYGAFASSKRENRHFTDMANLNFLMCKAMENPGLTPSFSLRTF
ncbi:hypothetical protein RJT34_20219 [Clitoria ternatea]|uniref:CFA20 domain-containing protein n=1 Tax=Clitoria ternatea TaxID=43366 RepID=A0AAN9ISU1_CLITE